MFDIFTPPLVRQRSIVIAMSVCLSVSLSAGIPPEIHVGSSQKFLCVLPMAVPRPSSSGVAIRYVLPVIWMTE